MPGAFVDVKLMRRSLRGQRLVELLHIRHRRVLVFGAEVAL